MVEQQDKQETIIRIDPDATYAKAALAERIGLTGRTIDRLLKRRKFPRPFYIGRTPYWKGSAMLTWTENRQREAMV